MLALVRLLFLIAGLAALSGQNMSLLENKVMKILPGCLHPYCWVLLFETQNCHPQVSMECAVSKSTTVCQKKTKQNNVFLQCKTKTLGQPSSHPYIGPPYIPLHPTFATRSASHSGSPHPTESWAGSLCNQQRMKLFFD